MSDASGWSEARKQIWIRYLHYLIMSHVRFGFHVVVERAPLAEIFGETEDIKGSNPYYFCFFFSIIDLMTQRIRIGETDPLRLVFDEQIDAMGHIAKQWPSFIQFSPPHIRRQLEQLPDFLSDEISLPLQAADFRAWWVRNQLNLDAGLPADKLELRPRNGRPVIKVIWNRARLIWLKANIDAFNSGARNLLPFGLLPF